MQEPSKSKPPSGSDFNPETPSSGERTATNPTHLSGLVFALGNSKPDDEDDTRMRKSTFEFALTFFLVMTVTGIVTVFQSPTLLLFLLLALPVALALAAMSAIFGALVFSGTILLAQRLTSWSTSVLIGANVLVPAIIWFVDLVLNSSWNHVGDSGTLAMVAGLYAISAVLYLTYVLLTTRSGQSS